MPHNPFRYIGPLDPGRDQLICVARETEVNMVIEGIIRGDYWAIFGPRQIGKTTFLRQIKQGYADATYIYFDFEVSPKDEGEFYDWVIEKFINYIPTGFTQADLDQLKKYKQPSFKFLQFLEKFTPKDDRKKIILLFDEFEKAPAVKSFLRVWRKVFNTRFHNEKLNQYAVVITGSVDLLTLTLGPNSPFNIAEFLYLKDFTNDEAHRFIECSFSRTNIDIDGNAEESIIAHTSGHPQLLQHTCHILIQNALNGSEKIAKSDVDQAIKDLVGLNSLIGTLVQELRADEKLRGLLHDILVGTRKKYFPHKRFSITGVGPIVESDSSCKIRNKVFEMILKEILLSGAESTKRYEFIKRCGAGSMGVVHKAKDSILNRIVAIKILNTNIIEDEASRENFLFEAKVAAQLSHENIVTVYDVGVLGDYYFMSMEFVDGADLSYILKAGRRFTQKQILYIMKMVLKALHHSHSREIIHRDIKPKNIMVSREGTIKIVDFGIAVIRDNYNTGETSLIRGTPYYISPEQIKSEKVDHRADIYSFGASMYHLTTGKVPFEGKNNEEIFMKHLTQTPRPIKDTRKDIREEVTDIIERCMEKEPENRFQDTDEILEILKTIKTRGAEATLIKREMQAMVPEEKSTDTYRLKDSEKVIFP